MLRTPARVRIVAIGDELLDGHTLDTNTHELSRFLVVARSRVVVKSVAGAFVDVGGELDASFLQGGLVGRRSGENFSLE